MSDQMKSRAGKRGDIQSTRQRVIVLTFPNAEDAEAWDEAGGPLPAGITVDVENCGPPA